MSKRTMQEKDKARITQLEKQVDRERAMILAMNQDSAQVNLKRLNEQIREKHEHLQQLEVTMSLKHDLEKARKALAEASSKKTNSLICQEQIRNLAESLRNARNRLDLLEGKLISVTEERDTAQDSLATLSEKLERVRDRRDESVGDLEVAEAKNGVKYTVRLEKELKAAKVERDDANILYESKCLDCSSNKMLSLDNSMLTSQRNEAQDSLATLNEKLDTKCVGCRHYNAESKLRDLKRALGIVLA